MSGAEVALATIGVLGTAMAGMIWIVKFLLKDVKKSLDHHVRAAENISKATQANTVATNKNAQVTGELKDFMVNLNGRLTEVTQQKINEQLVHHQTVEHETVKRKR